MKLVRVPCSVGNRLVGLSLYNPPSRNFFLHCQGNLFKGQGDPAHQAPKGPLVLLLLPALLPASLHWLDNSHYGSNFSRVHLKGKRGGEKTLNVIIQTATGVVFVII